MKEFDLGEFGRVLIGSLPLPIKVVGRCPICKNPVTVVEDVVILSNQPIHHNCYMNRFGEKYEKVYQKLKNENEKLKKKLKRGSFFSRIETFIKKNRFK